MEITRHKKKQKNNTMMTRKQKSVNWNWSRIATDVTVSRQEHENNFETVLCVQYGNIKKTKMVLLEMKSTVSPMKTILEGMQNWQDVMEEKISELEAIAI